MVPATTLGDLVGVGMVAVDPLLLTPESLVLNLSPSSYSQFSVLSARSGPLSVHPGGPVPLCEVRPVGRLEASNSQPSQDGQQLRDHQGCARQEEH